MYNERSNLAVETLLAEALPSLNGKAIQSENAEIHIKPGDDFSDIISAEKISDSEFAFDIWLFGFNKLNQPEIKGLYRNGIVKQLNKQGFFKRYRDNQTYYFLREQDNVIEQVETQIMKDVAYGYVTAIEKSLDFNYQGLKVKVLPEKLNEVFLKQSHLIFNDNFLEHLPNHVKKILKDDKHNAYFYFSNTIIKIDADGLQELTYNNLDGCIWKKHIKSFHLEYNPMNSDCHFARFITNVCNGEADRLTAFKSAIGYLLHNYSNPSSGQAVISYDEEITDWSNPKGGTGKGLFANAIKQVRDVTKIDGKKFDPRDKFKFQDISDSTQVVWLDDIRPDMGFDTFHSCLTDGWSIEKKYQDQFYIKPEDSPKMLICSNSILNDKGSTNKRRQFVIEFSNHYSKQIINGVEEPIKQEHGCTFFDKEEWNDAEWNKFYSYMFDCAVHYMCSGLMVYQHHGLNQNLLRQSTSDEFADWTEEKNFQVGVEYSTSEFFMDFRNTYYGMDSEFHQRGFTNWMKQYANSKNWGMKNYRTNSNNKFSFQAVRR